MPYRRLFKNKKNHSEFTPLRELFLIGFLFAINASLTAYINSSFIEGFVSEKVVGILYVAGSALALMGLIWMPKFLRKFGNYKTIIFSLLITAISLIVFSFTKIPWLIIVFFVFYLGFRTFVYFSLDEFLEAYSKKSNMGKTRGMYLTALSIGWMISPFLSGIIIDNLGFQALYLMALMFIFMAMVGVTLWFRNYKDPVYPKKVPLLDLARKVYARVNIYRVYRVSLLLQFFYAWMVIYTPIYLHQHLGFEWTTLGIMFAIMLLPFVMFELPLGKLEDQKYGEKEIMSIGLIVITASVIAIALVQSHNVILWTAILFLSRTGAAMVDISIETYFFKKVDAEETDMISFYRNAAPLAYIMAPLIVSALLAFMPINYTFIVLAILVITGLRFSTALVDTK